MKVVEHIEKSREPLFSYEIVPPLRGSSVRDIIDIVEALAPLNPPWIDVTSHSSSTQYLEANDGTIKKRTFKKRPGTLGICGVIQNRFKIDTVAHLLCVGFSKEETEDALIELSFLGIENVLALRGDAPHVPKVAAADSRANNYAIDLVEQIKSVNCGHFLDEMGKGDPFDFCIGVAGYPEKHFEASCLKADIQSLKRKVDAGASYIVTQMFFENQNYFDFVKACREAGITVPIVPGLKVLRSPGQLNNLPRNFYIDLPAQLVEEVQAHPMHTLEIGKKWCQKQVQELLDFGVPAVHFYVLNDVQAVTDVVRGFQK